MMKKYQISPAMRFFFLVAGSLLWVGIWLTGFATVHWLLYIPAVFFLFAAATGICPGMIFSNLLFGKRSNA
jgi:ABC-type polysaccharide/polyol phosphate export permease